MHAAKNEVKALLLINILTFRDESMNIYLF
jgi:hypothetical protein